MQIEHPDITRIRNTGLQPNVDGVLPECPVCMQECNKVYVTLDGIIAGCNSCLIAKDAYDFLIPNKTRRSEP